MLNLGILALKYTVQKLYCKAHVCDLLKITFNSAIKLLILFKIIRG